VVEAQTKDRGTRQFDAFFRRAGFVIEPVTEEQATLWRGKPTRISGKVAMRRD